MKNSNATSAAEEFFDSQAREWDARYQSRTYRERRELLLKIITRELLRIDGPRREIDVLDFGCGGGVLLKDLVQLGIRVTGVDSSSAMIEKVRARVGQNSNLVNLELLLSSSGEGAYEARQYDIVVCTSVLEFVPEMESVLARLCSVVREGGILIVSVPNRRSWLRRIEKLIHEYPRVFRYFRQFKHLVSDGYLNYQHHQLTVSELTEIVERYGVRHEEHRFHVTPRTLNGIEHSATVGMMIIAVFRK